MGNNTNISWCDHTFNCWWGCEKVSPGCANCYADTFAKFCGFGGPNGTKQAIWGKGAERRFFGDKHWNEPLEWNEEAGNNRIMDGAVLQFVKSTDDGAVATVWISGLNLGKEKLITRYKWDSLPVQRARVFCASMADVFEDRPDLDEPRQRLLQLIDDTPNLDWLLLTKRPENIRPLLERVSNGNVTDFRHMPNVWLGTTVENQEYADQRIPELLKIPARIHFLSVEPMLGQVNFSKILINHKLTHFEGVGIHADAMRERGESMAWIDWVICGGESGPKRRPFEIEWAQDVAFQTDAIGARFHMKQDGGAKSGMQGRIPDALWNRKEFPKV